MRRDPDPDAILHCPVLQHDHEGPTNMSSWSSTLSYLVAFGKKELSQVGAILQRERTTFKNSFVIQPSSICWSLSQGENIKNKISKIKAAFKKK